VTALNVFRNVSYNSPTALTYPVRRTQRWGDSPHRSRPRICDAASRKTRSPALSGFRFCRFFIGVVTVVRVAGEGDQVRRRDQRQWCPPIFLLPRRPPLLRYECVSRESIIWQQAKAAAECRSYLGIKGHLVEITSAAENVFVFNLGNLFGFRFGGYRDMSASDYSEPVGGDDG
jgi:hypothetical protein